MRLKDDDVQLMLAFRAGEESAFDALFGRWAPRLLRYLERMIGSPAVAEELVQEAFLRVHRARDRYEPDAKFSTWLFTIATNLARNELRRPFRRNPHRSAGAEGDAMDLEFAGHQRPLDVLVDARRATDRVERALDGLPERQRAALWLAAVEGLSYAEVARSLDTTEKSVKALVHRARAGLARRESPRLCRGGRPSLTVPGMRNSPS